VDFTIMFYMVIVVGVYFLFSELYLKRHLGIKRREPVSFLTGKRKPIYRYIDGFIFILFLFFLFKLNVDPGSETESYSPGLRASPLFGMFFLNSIVSGFEEWATNRQAKAYYHEWAGSVMLFVSFLLTIMM
jgi:hypothetical protein